MPPWILLVVWIQLPNTSLHSSFCECFSLLRISFRNRGLSDSKHDSTKGTHEDVGAQQGQVLQQAVEQDGCQPTTACNTLQPLICHFFTAAAEVPRTLLTFENATLASVPYEEGEKHSPEF